MMILTILMVFCAGSTYTIPSDEINTQKVFFGTCNQFKNPAEIDYETIIRQTPEYKEIQHKKLEAGTAKYWLLMSDATERVVRYVSEVAQEEKYDLISSQGYLSSLKKPIPAHDATQCVVDKIKKRKTHRK